LFKRRLILLLLACAISAGVTGTFAGQAQAVQVHSGPVSFAGTPTARTTASPARNNGLNEPIYFVHGISLTGKSDCGNWSPAIREYRRSGATGPLLTVGFYTGDTHCTTRVGRDGRNTSIAEIGRQLAWTIYNQYSRRNISVDAVGHSMGGLIIRSALTNVQRRLRGYPPYLYVEDVATLSTPHAGTSWARGCRFFRQCAEMVPGSTFLRSLYSNPQARPGTDWTVIGADDDDVVASKSAIGMLAGHKVVYKSGQGLEHGTVYKTTSGRYELRYWNFYNPRWINQRAGAAPVVVARNANFFWRLW